MRGQTTVLDVSVKRGFNLFMGKAQCGSCHFAPTFFGNAPPFYGISEAEILGVTKQFDTIHPVLDDDIGRFKNMEIDEFKHAIKTSTVRNAALTAPYMHNGGFKTLDEVIEFYNRGGGAGLGLNVPNQTLSSDKLHLTKQDKQDIISFIKSLTDTSGIRKFAL
jgi:cytochrome c peroxidase